MAPSSCAYQCSASYTVSIPSGSTTVTLTPGTVSGCTCYTGTATLPSTSSSFSNTMFSFTDGSTAYVSDGAAQCTLSVAATTQGVTCTGTYGVSGTSVCPARTPANGIASSGSFNIKPAAAGLFAAALVAANL